VLDSEKQAWLDPAYFFGGSTSMKSPFRFAFFLNIFIIILSVFWYTENTQSTSFKNFFSTTAVQEDLSIALPVTAAGDLPQKDRSPDDVSLLSRALRPARNGRAEAIVDIQHSDSLHEFIEQVVGGDVQNLVGVFVENVLALPVVQQPEGDKLYVSRLLGTVTQFQSAARHGITGLLAHNYLSGDLFFGLELGQEVNLIFGDGRVSRYKVEDIQRYEKLEGDFYTSNYVNLDTGEVMTTPDLFRRMYTGTDKVTFQTCIKNGSNWSWGRIFIVAAPL
jgi:hypothetical protein